jgi:hypothetical protein
MDALSVGIVVKQEAVASKTCRARFADCKRGSNGNGCIDSIPT